jgi:hypothetical protein
MSEGVLISRTFGDLFKNWRALLHTVVPLEFVSVVAELLRASVPLKSNLFVFVTDKDRRSHTAWFDLHA